MSFSIVAAYSDHSPTVKKVQVFEKYLLSWMQLYNLVRVKYCEIICICIFVSIFIEFVGQHHQKPKLQRRGFLIMYT